jgi:hypothetical protein
MLIDLYTFWLLAALSQPASRHFRRPGSQGRRRYLDVDSRVVFGGTETALPLFGIVRMEPFEIC